MSPVEILQKRLRKKINIYKLEMAAYRPGENISAEANNFDRAQKIELLKEVLKWTKELEIETKDE